MDSSFKSYWQDTIKTRNFAPLQENTRTNTVVIGGGIVGITTAYLLSTQGVDTIILEGGNISTSATAKTTAKITFQHGAIYNDLMTRVGKEKAFQYLDTNRNAITHLNKIITEHKIACDYKTQPAYLYATNNKEVEIIEKEKEAYDNLGVASFYQEKSILPFPVKASLAVTNQGQFHPLKYVYSLADIIEKKGCTIHENTRVLDIQGSKSPFKVITEKGEITCENVVVACHYPFFNDGKHGMYFFRMYQDRSYVLGIRTSSEPFDGMYININNPIYSLRYQFDDKGALLLLGGGNHRTAEKEDEKASYKELELFSHKYFTNPEINYTWSNQDCMTLDGIPYIGQMSSNIKGLYIATGFKKWGMTSGILSAKIISDLIITGESLNTDVFNPARFSVVDSAKNFIVNGLEIAENFIMKLMPISLENLSEVKVGEGKLIDYKNSKIGVYRDEDGNYFAVVPHCTHLGCLLKFNTAEKTWDCTCHGSRFNIFGDVIEGPATLPLKRIELQ